MALPSSDQLRQPTLSALHALGGAASIKDINKYVLQNLQPSPEEATQPHPGHSMTELEYRLKGARTYLKKFWPRGK